MNDRDINLAYQKGYAAGIKSAQKQVTSLAKDAATAIAKVRELENETQRMNDLLKQCEEQMYLGSGESVRFWLDLAKAIGRREAEKALKGV